MHNHWIIPDTCRTIPGNNLGERLECAKQLIAILRQPAKSAPESDSRTAWTNWIKGQLVDAADSDCLTFPRTSERTKGEFLKVDFCIEEKDRGHRILLAAESELDNTKARGNFIEQDFEKLLAVKSPFKLMIFSSEKDDGTDRWTNSKIIEKLQNNLENYGHHLQGETYIFIDYNERSGINGSFIAHLWQSSVSGLLDRVFLVNILPSKNQIFI